MRITPELVDRADAAACRHDPMWQAFFKHPEERASIIRAILETVTESPEYRVAEAIRAMVRGEP